MWQVGFDITKMNVSTKEINNEISLQLVGMPDSTNYRQVYTDASSVIYSGDTSGGSIHFADDLDEEGAGDSPAGNRDGVIIYSHNTNDFN